MPLRTQDDQQNKRYKLFKALPALGTYLSAESRRANPNFEGAHAVRWCTYDCISEQMWKTAWHMWSQNKDMWKLNDDAVYAIPLDVQAPGTVVVETERVAGLAVYGKWSGIPELRRYYGFWAFLEMDKGETDGGTFFAIAS